jgi:hypothetical protein
MPTRIQSAPDTPFATDHVRRYIIVVNGANNSPRRGHSHVLNARSTRFPNSHIPMEDEAGTEGGEEQDEATHQAISSQLQTGVNRVVHAECPRG